MENLSGTTEQVEVNPLDVIYGSEVGEPETDSAETVIVDEAATKEESAESVEGAEGETTDEVVGEQAEATDDDEVFVLETKDGTEEVKLTELRNGYLRQSDYTKKTQAIAEDRKAVEAERARIGQTLQILKDIESGIGELVMGEFAQVDWNTIRDTDPSQYLALKEAKEARENAIKNLKAKRDQVVADAAKAEAAKLHESLGWSDAAKRDSDIQLISTGIKAAGVPDDVFASVTNSALMSLVLDGIKHRELQKTKPGIVRKVKEAPKVTSKPTKQAPPETPKTGLDLLYG